MLLFCVLALTLATKGVGGVGWGAHARRLVVVASTSQQQLLLCQCVEYEHLAVCVGGMHFLLHVGVGT